MGKLTWSVTDPELDVLSRVGLAGMVLALQAWQEDRPDDYAESPIEAEWDSQNLTIEWPEDKGSADALLPLINFAWQTRGESKSGEGMGVFYFPGIHRGSKRDNPLERLNEHNGILNTFLQHPKIQGKTKQQVNGELQIDTNKRINVSYVEPKDGIRYRKAFSTLFHQSLEDLPDIGSKTAGRLMEHFGDQETIRQADKQALIEVKRITLEKAELIQSRWRNIKKGDVTLSKFIYPGATNRYEDGVEPSWTGTVRQAIPLFFAPTACYYVKLMNYDWVVVAPDVQDLQLYSRARRNLSVTHYGRKAGNPADAGLRVIARFSKYVEQLVSDQIEASVKTLEQVGERRIRCEVFQLGNTDWSPKQKVRSSFHRLRPTKATIAGYEILDRHMPNNFRRQKDSDVGFLMVPRPRPRIARNLIDGTYWYKDLFDVPDVLREQVQERSEQGDSLKSTWFDLLSFERNSLRNIMDDMTAVDEQSEEVDQIFVKAFHQALKKSYGREAARAEEGSRDWTDRIDDFRQATRRDLMKANTRKLLRETLTEFFSRAGPNRFLQEHADQIWDFIDHDRDWRRARDLALLSLVTYQAEDREELEEVVQEEVSE